MTEQDTQTDRLLGRVLDGDRAALSQLFAVHRAYLRRLVGLRLHKDLRTRVDPSDVVQETQLEAARQMDDYLRRRPLSFRVWLRRTALNRLADAQRRHTAARRNARRDVALPEQSSIALARKLFDGRPSEALRRREMAYRVRQAIDSLAEIDREVLLMRFYEELTNQEVAELLAIEPATASKRHGRALRRLHAKLVDLGVSGASS
ncbi:MAG: sigma-70 family RNA polymerase sigma factor [Pirellulaceae bacterium]|nr:sigma-70 family RNA polymerase sigma factor [Pirellulaceae bacterium]